jgi:hypothetical protein
VFVVRRAVSVLLLSGAVLGTGLSAPAAADPPREVTIGIQTLSFTLMPETRRVTGDVVHFEFRSSAYLSGEQPGVTSEHFRCVRRVGDVIRCSAEIETDFVGGTGHTHAHARVTCDAALFACEGTSHFKGVDNEGDMVLGTAEVRIAGGVGTAQLRLVHG